MADMLNLGLHCSPWVLSKRCLSVPLNSLLASDPWAICLYSSRVDTRKLNRLESPLILALIILLLQRSGAFEDKSKGVTLSGDSFLGLEQYLQGMFGGSQSHSRQEWSKKWESEIGPANGRDSASGCFDCNICLDFANDPVVTLCGHLYCWPCIYKWLTRDPSTTQQCPVCKAPVSQTTLVPLYGRGGENTGKSVASKATLDIPHRPPPYRPDTLPAEMTPSPRSSHHHHYFHYDRYPPSPSPLHFRTTARHFYPVSGGTAYALLPWVLGWFFRSPETPARARLFDSDSYHLTGEGGGVRARRQELQAERSLSRISVFLLCCLVLCVFLF